jgi:hypothetical protein
VTRILRFDDPISAIRAASRDMAVGAYVARSIISSGGDCDSPIAGGMATPLVTAV